MNLKTDRVPQALGDTSIKNDLIADGMHYKRKNTEA